VLLQTHELGEAVREEACPVMTHGTWRQTMHAVPTVGHERVQCPEGLLLVHVEEEERGHLRHALAVAHVRVVHRVGGEHGEQLPLPATCLPSP